ncbi:putative membrane protein YfcA [Allocatelliglobosispora scoriae]|uniref:Probable membrane transporter protein n=1 Tax=Allocatelliglobosispora scoriae TaxID=643052 RepID=A0A841BNN8_9ACTN|nr:sulfite exporter TauE/SafE family protein [Allocatelliglobosispora scoriae]MBB5869884.1 putative membrane protein YfcA [Allocatelliglobosispora scoriae]
MDLSGAALLVAAGVGAGTVNAIAGGGSLMTFPALVAVGLPPVAANVTNSIAISPGYLASVAGSHRDLAEERTRTLRLIPTVIVGTGIGCALLLLTPAEAFEKVVPFLVIGAAVLLALQEKIKARVGHPHQLSHRTLATHAMVGVSCIYGGYFGAALGVILMALLGLVVAAPLRRINAMKYVITAVSGLTTVAIFAVGGPVDWVAVAVLAPAAMLGGFLGARVARRLPARVLRVAIVIFAIMIGIILFIKAN